MKLSFDTTQQPLSLAYLGGAFGDRPPSSRHIFLQAQFDMQRIKKKYFALNQYPKDSSLPAPNIHKQSLKGTGHLNGLMVTSPLGPQPPSYYLIMISGPPDTLLSLANKAETPAPQCTYSNSVLTQSKATA